MNGISARSEMVYYFTDMVGVRASEGLKAINILIVLGLILLIAHLLRDLRP